MNEQVVTDVLDNTAMIMPPSTYDQVPYASHPYAQSQPDRLAVVASLFGMRPAPVDCCRVLELGCASGGNILPLAANFPHSTFLGIDASGREIQDGQRTIDDLKLPNVELRHLNILDITPDLGEFDYIVCHGVYSWVPPPVKDKILEICGHQLAPQGVAYVSYNTYPGWHLRGTAREIMLFHARKFSSPQEQVGHARAMLDFLVKSVSTNGDPYGLALKGELELLRDKADSYVFHEHLEEFNEPLYFYQFNDHARSHGLQFLGEAELGSMSLRNLPDHVAQTLHHLTDSFEEMEQYLDFLRNRMFRQTLLCRQNLPLDRRMSAERLTSLWVASPIKLDHSIQQGSNQPTQFTAPSGTVSTSDSLFAAALTCLEQAWPDAVPFERLVEDAVRRIRPDTPSDSSQFLQARSHLAACLVDACARRFVELHAIEPLHGKAYGNRPMVSPFARHQALRGRTVTNLRHKVVELSELACRTLPFVNGTMNREAISEAIKSFRGSCTTNELDQCLSELAGQALLLKANGENRT